MRLSDALKVGGGKFFEHTPRYYEGLEKYRREHGDFTRVHTGNSLETLSIILKWLNRDGYYLYLAYLLVLFMAWAIKTLREK